MKDAKVETGLKTFKVGEKVYFFHVNINQVAIVSAEVANVYVDSLLLKNGSHQILFGQTEARTRIIYKGSAHNSLDEAIAAAWEKLSELEGIYSKMFFSILDQFQGLVKLLLAMENAPAPTDH